MPLQLGVLLSAAGLDGLVIGGLCRGGKVVAGKMASQEFRSSFADDSEYYRAVSPTDRI